MEPRGREPGDGPSDGPSDGPRAFRIGQHRNVLVHKFVTSGTIEEKIELMLAEKRQLADELIDGAGEVGLTELPDDELLDLVRLDVARGPRRNPAVPWFPPHVPVAARRARVARVSDELRRNGVDVQPVHIEGRTIARSFWGRRWCHHLESCSDFENRLPRGRVYVRNGSVCHLDVHAGGVDAMVVGSDLYHVVVRIRKLGQVAWKTIRAECAGRVGSVLELLQGRLSDHVLRVVTDPDRGLFPKPGEITLTCDCPDWAVMCKHAAAVLYGIGSRLDDRPELLFRLRDVDADDLVVGDMALPDAAAGDDVLAGDLADIFGIDLDPADSGEAAARQKTTGRRRRGRPRRTGAPPSGFQPTGRRVAELRRRGGFSVPEFAGLLRVSGSTVYRWEAAGGPLALRAGQEDALQVLYLEIEKRQTE